MSGVNTGQDQLSDFPTELMIDEYGGAVESQFAKDSFMREFVTVRPVKGTDTIVNNRVGRTRLQALTPGVRPDSLPTGFGKVQLVVDTVILARDTRSMLNDFQTHFSAREELGKDHGKEIGKFFDQAFIIQVIKGSTQAAPTGLNSAIGAGKQYVLASANDELDPDKLAVAIENVVMQMEQEDIDVNDLVVLVGPKEYMTLYHNNKLMSRDYSPENGDYSNAMVREIAGARIIKTARIPTAAITGHSLSNAENGNAYDVSANDAKCVAVIMHPKSLLAGETIPLTTDVWFNREEKAWFIDAFIAFGVTVNRPDVCGTVRKA